MTLHLKLYLAFFMCLGSLYSAQAEVHQFPGACSRILRSAPRLLTDNPIKDMVDELIRKRGFKNFSYTISEQSNQTVVTINGLDSEHTYKTSDGILGPLWKKKKNYNLEFTIFIPNKGTKPYLLIRETNEMSLRSEGFTEIINLAFDRLIPSDVNENNPEEVNWYTIVRSPQIFDSFADNNEFEFSKLGITSRQPIIPLSPQSSLSKKTQIEQHLQYLFFVANALLTKDNY